MKRMMIITACAVVAVAVAGCMPGEAMINYACCEESPEELVFWADTMDIIDEYEVCLDVAEFSKGSREMSWAEFGAYRDELHNFLNGLQKTPTM